MADNVIANAGAGGATFATDDIAGVHYPRTKIAFGADGAASDVATGNPLPTVQTGALPAGANTIGGVNLTQYTPASGRLPVDGSGVTQPISAAALPLPTGAATEATLSALNTKTATAKTSDYDTGAGTDTVPMVGLALPASGGAVAGGTTTNPLRIDPVGTTVQPVNDNGGSLTVDTGQLPATLGQKTAAASMSVVLASDQGAVPVSDGGGSLTVDGSVSLAAALPAGTNNIGDVDVLTLPALPTGGNTIGAVNLAQYTPATGRLPVDGSGVTQPVSAASLPLPTGAATAAKQPALGTAGSASADVITVQGIASMTALKVDGSAVTQPVSGAVGLAPATSGGSSVSRVISAASTNATSVKASAGQVYGWAAYNLNAAARYLKLYNKASSPTVGTDTPVMTILIPGNTAGAGTNIEMPNGIAFGTGIAMAITTGIADADTGAVAANEIVVNLWYK